MNTVLYPVNGKTVFYNGLENTIRYKNTKNQAIDLIVRLSGDGAAFRYFLPEKSTNFWIKSDESRIRKVNQEVCNSLNEIKKS